MTVDRALDHVGETYSPTTSFAVGSLLPPHEQTVDTTTGEILTPEVVDPDRFFRKQGLLHASLRVAVLGQGATATGPGGTLWRYRNGVYLPDGPTRFAGVDGCCSVNAGASLTSKV